MASALLGTLTAFATLAAIFWRFIKRILETLDRVEANAAAVEQQNKDIAVLKKANKAMIRRTLIDQGEAYIARGYVTIKELEEFNSDFDTYSNGLGGNGSAATVHRAVNQTLEIRAA